MNVTNNTMKNYFKNNITPIAIGFSLGCIYWLTVWAVKDVIITIALINSK
jgi:hypothetical protein